MGFKIILPGAYVLCWQTSFTTVPISVIRTKLQIHYGQYRHTDNDGQQIIWSTIPELAPHIVVQDDKNPELINHLSIASS